LLGLASALLGLAAAMRLLRRRGDPGRLLGFAQFSVWVLFGVGFALELGEHIGDRDWMHSFWAAEGSLECLFLGSGVLFCRVWPDDARLAFGRARRSGAIDFLGMILVLGFMPLVLPDPHPTGRNLGEPVRRVWELALWGFGGPLPEALRPITDAETARGVGHLPREVTVALGTTLIAAWLVIGFSLIALLARLVRNPSRRLVLLLLAPPVATAAYGSGLLGLRTPFSDPMCDELWTSDPGLMRSYGPTLLVAHLLALCLVLATRLRR